MGKPVYASDDATFTLTATSNSYVGRIVRWISTGVVMVEFCAAKGELGAFTALTDSSGGTASDTIAVHRWHFAASPKCATPWRVRRKRSTSLPSIWRKGDKEIVRTRPSSRAVVGMYYEALEAQTGQGWIDAVSNFFTSDQPSETYNWLGMPPAMREVVGGRHAKGFTTNGVTIANKHFEATLTLR